MLLGGRRMSERDMTRIGTDMKPPMAGQLLNPLLNSKSVPTLHHIGKYKDISNVTWMQLNFFLMF